jgi:two-component system C4-dicarboxylate transport sensor histidine kinase DctB
VLVNLLTNALHALAETEGPKQLEICVESVGDRVAIDIRDTGPGIAGEDLDRIFDPFYTTKSVDEGTGLGLYISQDIVASMGGRIEAESEPGEGTVFRVLLQGVDPGVEATPG